MKKILLLSLKIVGGLLATVVVLLLVLGVLLNTNSFQNNLLRYSTQMLSEKLNTEVKIDSVSIGFFSNDVRLKGVSIDDLEHRKMLQMERLTVSMEMLALLTEACLLLRMSSAQLDTHLESIFCTFHFGGASRQVHGRTLD